MSCLYRSHISLHFCGITNMVLLFLFIIQLTSNIIECQEAEHPFERLSPENCVADEQQFYDFARLRCGTCPDNAIGTTNRLGCRCKPGFKKTEDYGGVSLICTACAEGLQATPDGWECATCEPEGMTPDPEEGSCGTCVNPNAILNIRNRFGITEKTQSCSECKQNTRPDTELRQFCVPCNPSTEGKGCACSKPEAVIDGLCFEDPTVTKLVPADTPTLYAVKFSDKLTVDSAYFRAHLRSTATLCAKQNLTACQLIGNLCTLNNYRRGANGETTVCDVYTSMTGSLQWPQYMPWLYYAAEAKNVLKSEKIPTRYAFQQTSEPHSRLDLVAARYNLDGSFIGIESLVQTNALQLCPAADQAVLAGAFQFGRKYQQKCLLSVKKLWEAHRGRVSLFDVYLTIIEEDNEQLLPIPVLVRNYENNQGKSVNQETTNSNWQLTRRIFLVDTEVGVEADQAKGELAKAMRYASDITLNVELKTNKQGQIYPPYLTVTYASVTADEYAKSDATVEVRFAVRYSLDDYEQQRVLEIVTLVLSVLAGIWTLIKTYSWKQRAGKISIDFALVLRLVLTLLTCWGDVALLTMVALGGWLTFAYKAQRVAFFMMLTEEQQFAFYVYMLLAFLLKVLELFFNIVDLALTETFFIDWERPRGKIIPSGGEPSESGDGPSVADYSKYPASPITIWRTYFVCNEWNELQNYRKTSPTLQVFVMLLLLEGVGLKRWAIMEPGFSLEDAPVEYESTRLSRFAVSAGLYLFVGLLQWAVSAFAVETLIHKPFHNFMDLCSIANVSVLALSRARYGYYVHGRSVHGHSDTNMAEMNDMLQRERDNLVGQRGLEPGTELQTFTVALPAGFREKFDAIREPLKNPNLPATRLQGMDPDTATVANKVNVYNHMNQFLGAFIDQRMPDIGYVIKDRTLVEAIFDVDMAIPENTQQGVFYRDKAETGYSEAFFYGHEWAYLSFDLTLFCCVDLLFQNYLLAGIAVFAASTLMRLFGSKAFAVNLANTSLVDARFLI